MKKITTRITPDGTLDVLSQWEVARLAKTSSTQMYDTFRRCALAVLNTGSEMDNTQEVLDAHKDFAVSLIQQERGIKLEITNAPANAFVDGKMVAGIKEHVFAALRDLVYINNELMANCALDMESQEDITNAVFHILRNAGAFKGNERGNLVVCWGGHSIGETEYQYTKKVGYEMGLRGLDICTGCGPGAMKGPMKGAAIAHAKQRQAGRYIGITEPGIIAAESPNPIVNSLIIMPDIEKRLEAFVRTGHGIVVFPGGAGTAEEILYILGILLNPKNQHIPFPLVFTGPKEAAGYFEQIDDFVAKTLGKEAQALYQIIIDDPKAVARAQRDAVEAVQTYRRDNQDAYYFNWLLTIDEDFQRPFKPTHDSMAALNLSKNQPVHKLAANLRKAFSGIVDGNVKADGIKAVAELGPYHISGETDIIEPLDALLKAFVAQKRMKIPTQEYVPCYKIVR
ncbi:nucleotide 5'-monophosphate nucleosidase PpnN [Marinagarivorans cellulosilyticus]|uniref:AMP nucleosidase n=1 Tax=Marinagarivorans cellulosilyticus TaxID=2721545 RepID=A0AAN1WK88_9GAMM|nr:nucleotide 5'-monophosphate nucleosidase PpnN [Marinagarivorans cellulosilyticus]BCD99146.1 pyrimidine/purine-5'-nucleotide nucleosidase [Marinagarivorans cellulosilyticus]